MKRRIDMSEKAILRRLRTVDRLRELCLILMKAEKLPGEKTKVKDRKNDRNEQK